MKLLPSSSLSSSRGFAWAWLALLLLGGAVSGARPVVEAGAGTAWKYVADGRDPGPRWLQADYDDAAWLSGPAPLGFGDPGMGTILNWGTDAAHKPMTTWFRHGFDLPEVKPGTAYALLYCVDDGAVIYLNGREVGRTNLPAGPITPETRATRALSDPDEGYYLRLVLPPGALQAGRNVIAVEVHQCNAASSDLYFDLALQPLPPALPPAVVTDATRAAVMAYRQLHYLGPDVRVPDGYLDGGREMKVDAQGHARSGRELLVIDRDKDAQLAADIAFVRSPAVQALSPLERAQRIARHIDQRATPYGGMRWCERMDADLVRELRNQPVLVSDWVEQSHNGVCRHRALLFKVLADEAGLKATLTRGNYARQPAQRPTSPHVWNELILDNGRRVLVDVTLKGARQTFPDLTSREVVDHYLKVDNTPWYAVGDGK